MDIYAHLSPYNKEHYLNRYIKLIEHYTENPCSVNYEVHHILPKSIFEQHKDDPNNLVKLPIRAHFIAHHLLHKIIGSKMTVAYFMMCNRLDKKTSKSYESARTYQSKIMEKTNPNHDGKQAKRSWANSSKERRSKQAEIMLEVNRNKWSNPTEKEKLSQRNKQLKSILCDIENVNTGESFIGISLPEFSSMYNLSKSGLYAAKVNNRVYKNEWVIKTHSDQLGNKDDQSPTDYAASATGP